MKNMLIGVFKPKYDRKQGLTIIDKNDKLTNVR